MFNSFFAFVQSTLYLHYIPVSNVYFKDYCFQFLVFNWFLGIFTCTWFSCAKIAFLFHRFGILFCRCSYLLYISKDLKLWFLKYFQISVISISLAIKSFTFQVYLMRLLVRFLSTCVNRIWKLISWGSFHFLLPLTTFTFLWFHHDLI